MKKYKAVKVPARIAKEVVKVICDLCGEAIEDKGFSADKVTVEKTEGTSFPEGGCATITSFDVCIKCFDLHIVPLFKNKPLVKDIDW